MNSIKYLTQQEPLGCGIACVAMLTKTSYDDVNKTFRKLFASGRTNAEANLSPLLNKYSIEHEVKKSRCWEDIDGTAIVGVNRVNNRYHWVLVIKDSKRFFILDPSNDEDGGIFPGHKWAVNYNKEEKNENDYENSYVHSGRLTEYISIKSKINNILI